MITFNDVLTLGGLAPSQVKILRHGQVGDPKVYDTWRNDRPVFERYQELQGSNMIPEKGFVASFVVSRAAKTTFAGMYRNMGWTPTPVGEVDPLSGSVHTDGRGYSYDLALVPGWEDYEGRLVIEWPGGRSWHRRADSLLWPVVEIAHQHDPWPGWREFHCEADELATLPHEWRSMLSHTKGIYLLVDLDDAGKQYVGSAKGTDNLFGRLLGYSKGGTNGNRGLTRGHRYVVSVLEPVAMLTPDQTIEAVEAQWKDRLGTRQYGLNQN